MFYYYWLVCHFLHGFLKALCLQGPNTWHQSPLVNAWLVSPFCLSSNCLQGWAATHIPSYPNEPRIVLYNLLWGMPVVCYFRICCCCWQFCMSTHSLSCYHWNVGNTDTLRLHRYHLALSPIVLWCCLAFTQNQQKVHWGWAATCQPLNHAFGGCHGIAKRAYCLGERRY